MEQTKFVLTLTGEVSNTDKSDNYETDDEIKYPRREKIIMLQNQTLVLFNHILKL